MGSKILSGKGLKRKRGALSSGVKKVKNGKKHKKTPANKKHGHGLKKKKQEKPNPRRRNQIKKENITTFSHKT